MQSSTSFAVPTKLSKKDTPEAKYTITTTAASFATGPLRRRVLIAFMILTEANNNKTVRVLYSNPGPSHVVTNRFPVERFVFPPYGEGQLRRSLSFTFVITTSDGERVYGHTMHTVNGEAMVCLSAHPWCSYFQRVMHLYRVNGTEEGLKMIRSLLERGQQSSSLHAPPNAPPQSLRASGSGDFNAMPVLSDETVSPVIVASPASLLHSFTTDQLFQILGALLTERRVIIVGPTYGSTTNVMMSLLALLAPFEWQHTLITVLPAEMALVLAAPTPYFVGIVASQQHILESTPLEGVVIVQLEHEVAATNAPYEEYGATDSERRLVCSNILYHEESPHTLPLTGMTESRIRWQLQLFRRAPQMRRTNATMEIDPAESYSKGTDMCAHDMLCQIFMSYYASWIGPRLSQWIEDRGKPVAATPANNNGVAAAATSPQEVTGDAGFFAMLEESQCYQELMYRLTDVLHHSNSAAGITNAARDEGVQTSAATINNPYSPTTSLQASLWFLNPFLLTVVQQHPEKFPKKFAELSRPEVLDFGAGLGRNRLHRAASDGHMYKSKTSSRAAVCGAVNLAATYHEHIRVRSLLLRSMSCCTNDIDAATDVEELNDLTPVSSSKSSQ